MCRQYKDDGTRTIVHVAIAEESSTPHRLSPVTHHLSPYVYAGHIVINDQVKADSAEAIAQLKKLGVKKTVMLTGDREEVASRVAQQLGIDEYHAELLPTDKVTQISAISHQPSKLAFVGDGINDARGVDGRPAVKDSYSRAHSTSYDRHCTSEYLVCHWREGCRTDSCCLRHRDHVACRICRRRRHGTGCAQCHASTQGIKKERFPDVVWETSFL